MDRIDEVYVGSVVTLNLLVELLSMLSEKGILVGDDTEELFDRALLGFEEMDGSNLQRRVQHAAAHRIIENLQK